MDFYGFSMVCHTALHFSNADWDCNISSFGYHIRSESCGHHLWIGSNRWTASTSISDLSYNHSFSCCMSTTSGFISDRLGNYKRLTIIGVILTGIGPFGILWLYHDHQRYQSLNQYNTTAGNLTTGNYSQSTKPATEPAYTLPWMVFFLLMSLYCTTSNDTLLEVCGLSVCKKHDADFARQKLWGNINFTWSLFEIPLGSIICLDWTGYAGLALSPVLCGVLVDWISEYLGGKLEMNNLLETINIQHLEQQVIKTIRLHFGSVLYLQYWRFHYWHN